MQLSVHLKIVIPLAKKTIDFVHCDGEKTKIRANFSKQHKYRPAQCPFAQEESVVPRRKHDGADHKPLAILFTFS